MFRALCRVVPWAALSSPAGSSPFGPSKGPWDLLHGPGAASAQPNGPLTASARAYPLRFPDNAILFRPTGRFFVGDTCLSMFATVWFVGGAGNRVSGGQAKSAAVLFRRKIDPRPKTSVRPALAWDACPHQVEQGVPGSWSSRIFSGSGKHVRLCSAATGEAQIAAARKSEWCSSSRPHCDRNARRFQGG